MQVDKKIFEQYVKKPNPYAKFMREEFLQHKEEVSEASYNKIEKINENVLNNFKF